MRRQALMMQDVFPEIVFEAGQSVQDEGGGVEADGTVGGIGDVFRRCLDAVQHLHVGFTVQHLPKQGGQLAQTDPARGTLPAGLGVAQVQEA